MVSPEPKDVAIRAGGFLLLCGGGLAMNAEKEWVAVVMFVLGLYLLIAGGGSDEK